MKIFTRNTDSQLQIHLMYSCLLWLLCLSQPAVAQSSQRFIDPDPDPSQPCSPAYSQRSGANYVAANHLSGSFGAADIGATGVNTTIDVGLYYGGTVVFSGVYHIRGNVRFINGTIDLQPGTTFIVEGLNGQNIPATSIPDNTVIEVENASLELTGAAIYATCPRAWGSIRLLDHGRIHTRADAEAMSPAGNCSIQDALIAIDVRNPGSGYSTGEYYLNNTDFVNNGIGVYDYYKSVARAGEGVHYCNFRADANAKTPLTAFSGTGVRLSGADQPLGTNNYAAASIDHSIFHHLSCGIYGTAQQLRIMDNRFDYIWDAAISLQGGNGTFGFTPMYVQRNNITIRGANPLGYLTTYGIMGEVYAQGNLIQGDAADPASNAVEQVGMFMLSPNNGTQTDNTFQRLDKGIEASVDDWFSNGQRDISGNLFRNVVKGISLFTYFGAPISSGQLHIRCNSFENPGSLAGAVALNIEGPDFPTQIGDNVTGNGNRFVTPGLPFIEPIISVARYPFIYFGFNSRQEDFAQASPIQRGFTYTDVPTGGNPVTACTGAGYTNGINNRSAVTKPLVSTEALQNAYDSLRLSSVGTIRRHTLLNTLLAATTQRQDFAGLEAYLASLPNADAEVYTPLGCWLLATYRNSYREADAQRVRTALLARRPADLEVSSFVQLSDVLAHLRRPADPLAQPAPADVAALRQVAASGTASARVACPVARRYEPACPCRFPAQKAAQALAQRGNWVDAKQASLGHPYPNPASDWIRIPYSLPRGAGPARLEVRNALGQLLWSAPLSLNVGETQVSVSQLLAGLYQIALVVSGQPSATQRFAVTH